MDDEQQKNTRSTKIEQKNKTLLIPVLTLLGLGSVLMILMSLGVSGARYLGCGTATQLPSGGVSQSVSVCGDGIIASDEACDDSNLQNNDGCSAACTIEQDSVCGEYSYFEFNRCYGSVPEGVCIKYDFNANGAIGSPDYSTLNNILTFCPLSGIGSYLHYAFDGSATDSSLQKVNGTEIQGVLYSEDRVIGTKSLQLNGTSSYIQFGDPSAITDITPISISLWIKPESTSGVYLVSKRTNGQTGFWRLSIEASGELAWLKSFSGGSYEVLTPANAITQNTWQHIAVTWDGTNNISGTKIYINGTSTPLTVRSAGGGTALSDSGNNFVVGSRDGVSSFYSGLIDDLQLYDELLTGSAVQQIYSATNTTVCGNGVLNSGEACDDGNTISNDGCSASCTVEPMDATCGVYSRNEFDSCFGILADGVCSKYDFVVDGVISLTDLSQLNSILVNCNSSQCGNGVVESPEQCDDGNTTGYDGCSVACTLQQDATCAEFSLSEFDTCFGQSPTGVCAKYDFDNDGSIGGSDNSNLSSLIANCSPSICGNGVVESPEQCDDGNTTTETCSYGQVSCNVCNNSCQNVAGITAYCGDSIRNGNEQCDDGNVVSGDGCSASCQSEGGNPPVVGTLFNSPNNNIFDTYDPLCNGSDPSIIFCDGFEDGVFLADGSGNGSAADDYWGGHGFWPPADTDPVGREYAECNTGNINTSRADYGAAGTQCTATTHWGEDLSGYSAIGQQGSHAIKTVSGSPGQVVSIGPKDISYRFYFRHVGTESTRCKAGWPNCPAFQETGGSSTNNNGWKYVEWMPFNDQGGIHGALVGSWSKADVVQSDRNLFGFGDTNCSVPVINNQQNYPSGSPLPYFDHIAARGNWIFMEARLRVVSGSQHMQLWMDDCGADGMGCTGTPTLVADSGVVDSINTCFNGNGGEGFSTHGIRAVWMNFSNGGALHGEIQFDEIVARDRTILDQPIGFAPILTATSSVAVLGVTSESLPIIETNALVKKSILLQLLASSKILMLLMFSVLLLVSTIVIDFVTIGKKEGRLAIHTDGR